MQSASGTRQLRGDLDQNHVTDSVGHLRTQVAAGGATRQQALDALTHSRDPRQNTSVPAVNRPDGTEAAQQLRTGFTRQEFNAVLAGPLGTTQGRQNDPATASALVHRASENPALFDRVVNEGTRETRQAFTQAVLADATLEPGAGARMVQRLASTPPSGRNAVSLDQAVSTAYDTAAPGLARMMAHPGSPSLAEAIGRGTRPETQMQAMRGLLRDDNITPEQRAGAMRGLMRATSRDGLNHLVSNARSPEERDAIAGVISTSVPLQERVGRDLTRANQQSVIDQTLQLPLPQGALGRTLSVMIHPMNMSAGDKNALIDHLQDSGGFQRFLSSQIYMPYTQSLLPGLNQHNAAAVSARFRRLSEAERDNPTVSDPAAIGVRTSNSATRGVSSSDSESGSTQVMRGGSTLTTSGGGFTIGGKIPIGGRGELSPSVNYARSHQWGNQNSRTRTDETTHELGRSYEETFTRDLDLDARGRYQAAVRNWSTRNAYREAADNVSDRAANRSGSRNFQRERDRIYQP